MQNSGIGNAVNPLLSLTDRNIYSIPLLLIIGWRGEPGVADEPQHISTGNIQNKLLELLDIPFEIIDNHEDKLKEKIDNLLFKSKPIIG